MCRLLNISRQTYYNHLKRDDKKKVKELQEIDNNVKRTFDNSRGSYGTRTIKATLEREGIVYSRPKISESMKRQHLKSKYNMKRKYNKQTYNKQELPNIVERKFKQPMNEVLTSDLTYFKIGSVTYYICFIIDLYNSEIVGFSIGANKTAELVLQAFTEIKFNLNKVKVFHTDRGTEFKNEKIDKLLSEHKIIRSLSSPGCPYDNAVSESAFKTLKHAWLKGNEYTDILELRNDINTYVTWYNNIRPHSKLDYLSPVEYRLKEQSS